jgi:hypothetical protein
LTTELMAMPFPLLKCTAPDMTASGTNTNVKKSANLIETTAIVTHTMTSPADVGPNPKQGPALAGIGEAPFGMGIHLDMDPPARPLCHMDCDNGDSNSDDDSIFVDLSRD